MYDKTKGIRRNCRQHFFLRICNSNKIWNVTLQNMSKTISKYEKTKVFGIKCGNFPSLLFVVKPSTRRKTPLF